MNTTVSFPGLGIYEISFSRVAFSLFGKDIYWYGVIIMLGVIAAVLHAYIRSKREGIKVDDLLDLTIYIVLFGVLGARLYYVLTTLNTHHYDSFVDVIAIWDGGLAIYGGIIAGGLALVVVSLIKKINVFRVLDMVGPGVMLAQAIGRWGNFANGEAFGYEVAESSPLYFLRMGVMSDFAGNQMKYYHPTFLYESLWNILGFVIITVLYKKKKFNGQNALMYLAWYGFGRMFIEGLRTDSLYVGSFRISQVVGAVCFAVAGGLLVAGLLLKGKGKLDGLFGGLLIAPPAPLTVEGETKIETDEGDAYENVFGGVSEEESTPDEDTPGDALKEDPDEKTSIPDEVTDNQSQESEES
ncbi:MAG: prolipoprotein diacylglyceryl transferase [Ruminococcaceae bacterium]|nr:prolipoprotein diacylglyceryl transferase [Oscillospiraceae bacterium]